MLYLTQFTRLVDVPKTTTTIEENTMHNIITVENEWQDIHVHAPGCNHINKSVRALAGADVMEWPSEEHAAVFFFGEVAADEHDWGTPEWSKLVRLNWKVAARRFGCTSQV